MKPEKEKKGFYEVALSTERLINSLQAIEVVGQLTLDPKQEGQLKYWLDRISDKIEPILKTYKKRVNVLIKKYGIENQNQKGKSVGMYVPLWSEHFETYTNEFETISTQEEKLEIPNIFPLELLIIGETIPGGIFKYTDWLFNGATLQKKETED